MCWGDKSWLFEKGKAALAGLLTTALTNINLTHTGTILPHMLTRAGWSTAITDGSVILRRTALGSFCDLWSQPAQLGAADGFGGDLTNWRRLISWSISVLATPPKSALTLLLLVGSSCLVQRLFNLLLVDRRYAAISLSPQNTSRAQFSTSCPFAEMRPHTSVATKNQKQCPYLSRIPSASHTFSHGPDLGYTSSVGTFQRKPAHTLASQRVKITKSEHQS